MRESIKVAIIARPMASRVHRLGLACALALALLGCSGEAPMRPPASASATLDQPNQLLTAPQLSFAGCRAITSAPTCVGPQRELRIRVEGHEPGASVNLRLDGARLDPERAVVLATARGSVVVVSRPRSGMLEIAVEGHAPAQVELVELSGDYARTKTLLTRFPAWSTEFLAADTTLSAHERFLLEAQRARSELLRETRSVEPPEAALARLAAAARAVDELSRVPNLAAIAANLPLATCNLHGVEALLEHVEAAHASDLLGRHNARYYRAQWDRCLGLQGKALIGFEHAIEEARASGSGIHLLAALLEKALLLTWFGRLDEAARLGEQAQRVPLSELPARARRSLRSHSELQLAWMKILHRRHDPEAPDPRPKLRELLVDFDAEGDDALLAISHLNLAVAELDAGELAAAELELAAIEATQLDDYQRLYYALTRFRLDLARGLLERAHSWLVRAEALARRSINREFALELLEARAELELAREHPHQALAAFSEADTLAEILARRVPVSEGRSSYWTTLSESRSRHVELALELDEPERALCTVLAARARHLRSLANGERLTADPERARGYTELLIRYREQSRRLAREAEDAWQLSERAFAQLEQRHIVAQAELDALLERAMGLLEREPSSWDCGAVRPTQPRQAQLTAYPGREGASWWVFLERGRDAGNASLVVERFVGSAQEAAAAALTHFAETGALEEVDALTIVPLGAMLSVNFRALAPLSSGALPLRYSLGLGRPPRTSIPASAAVIGSGQSNLAFVDADLDAARAALAERGLAVRRDWDPHAEAQQPGLLHYAGHAFHQGYGGWGSHLILPSGRELGVEELLLAPRSPALVVLSACEAGSSDTAMLDGGMNLGVAWLLAGAELVIAADRKVDDSAAQSFTQALYAALPHGEPLDADALVAALAQVKREGGGRFDAWRAWVP